MLSDRLRIQTQHRFPELVLSAQVLLNCGGGGTCHVGSSSGPCVVITTPVLTHNISPKASEHVLGMFAL